MSSMEKRRNVLLITSDQQHWHTLGCLNPEVKTPNLDRLAASGMMYSRAYCPNPTCTPTRASMITGTYPSQHGAYSLGTKLDEGVHTVGEDFQQAGYRTALVGKAHFQQVQPNADYPSLESYPTMQDLDFWRKFDQPFYGFDHVELARNHTDEAHIGQHYALWMEEKGFDWRKHFRHAVPNENGVWLATSEGQKHTWSIPEEYHYDAWIAERTNALMQQYKDNDENFFLWASFFDPHPSYLVPEPWDKMYDPGKVTVPQLIPGEHDRNPAHFRLTQEEKPDFSQWQEKHGNGMHGCHSHRHDRKKLAKDIAVYYGMISLMDKYIGRILDKLEELGLAENTLVVFTTDHGHFYGQHGLTAKGPFHYEDMVKVPFLVRHPDNPASGKQSPAMQSLVDLAPSFLSFCGIEPPIFMTGRDQNPVWRGECEQARDHVIVENRHQPTTFHLKTYVDSRYKITVYFGREYGEIFDLENDPGEIKNLWDDPASQLLKAELTWKLLQAELGKEVLSMPRVACA